MLVRVLLVLAFMVFALASIRADELSDLQAFAKAAKGECYKHGEKQCRLEFGRETSDADMVALGKMPTDTVMSLNIVNCSSITDTGFLAIASMPNLSYLNLPSQLSDTAYVGMAKRFPKVASASISFSVFKERSPLTTAGLKSFADMPSLLGLSLHRTAVDDTCWEVLSKMPRLMNLAITGSKLTGEGIEKLSKCSRLNNLDFEKLTLTAVGVGQLSKVESLSILRIVECGVDDQGLSGLSKHSKLWNVTLQGNPISDAGVESLAKIKTLADVTISSPKLTNAVYTHLSAMTSLRVLSIYGGSITAAGKAEFQKAKPKVTIN